MPFFFVISILWLLSQHFLSQKYNFMTKLTTQINIFFSICLKGFFPLINCYLNWLLRSRKLACSTHSTHSELSQPFWIKIQPLRELHAIYTLIFYFVWLSHSLSSLLLTQPWFCRLYAKIYKVISTGGSTALLSCIYWAKPPKKSGLVLKILLR